MHRIVGIVPAAGESTRLGTGTSKVLENCFFRGQNMTILEASIMGLLEPQFDDDIANYSVVESVVVACRESDRDQIEKLLSQRFDKKVSIVIGGNTRQESVFNAIKFAKESSDYLLIHDAARPLLSSEDLKTIISKMIETDAAILASPVKSTIKKIDPKSSNVLKTVSRKSLWLAQTPQSFSTDLIYKAHKKAVEDQFTGTDDSELVERMGRSVSIVESSSPNFKITTQSDLHLARLYLQSNS